METTAPLELDAYVAGLSTALPATAGYGTPWAITADAAVIVRAAITALGADYEIRGEIAIHRSATVEPQAVLKPPCLIGPGGFVASHAYLRGGVFLGGYAIVGPSVEIKSSLLFAGSRIAHLSFVGDSIVGREVNIEAGAVLANRWNEREEKEIVVAIDGRTIRTGVAKFGALVGDRCHIGANAVLSPGTVLPPDSVVARLQLVDQSVSRGR